MGGVERLFKPGQEAESRSFCNGYRGAWFRCKIRNVRRKDGSLMFETKYEDFPDQKIKWEKVYRHPSGVRKELKLMFRPRYPALFKEGEVPDISSISEVAIIVNNTWQEGDLVDWFCQDCYWSGKITKVLGNDKLMVELFPPPDGEGSSYEALAKDLRPSLDWSPHCGWALPKPVRKGQSPCARLVKPSNKPKKAAGPEMNSTIQNVDKGTKSISSLGSSSDSLSSDIIEKISERYTVKEPWERDKAQNPTQSAIKEDENTVKEPLEVDKDQNPTQSAIKEDERTVKEPPEVDEDQNPTQSAIEEDENTVKEPLETGKDQNPTQSSIKEDENTVKEPMEVDKDQNPTQSAIEEDESTVKEPRETDKDQNPTQSAIREDDNAVKEPMEIEKDQNPTQSAIKEDGQNASSEGTENKGGENGSPGNPSKKMRIDRSRNTMSSDAIEAAVLDLEELRNRVKWIKGILQFGIPLPNSKHSSWTFVEHKAPSLPK